MVEVRAVGGLRQGVDRADRRWLDLTRALDWAGRVTVRAWTGAWGGLLFLSLLLLVPLLAPLGLDLDGALGVAYGGLLTVASLVVWGALTRISVTDDLEAARRMGLGPGGIQFGALELRIVWALVLNLIFLSLIGCILALVTLAVFGMAELDVAAIQARDWAAVGPVWKLVALGLFSLFVLGLPLLLITRLSMFAQASAGRGRTTSLNTMGIGYGSFGRLFLVIFLFALALIAVLWLGWVSPFLIAFLLPWFWWPLSQGALGGAYRQLEYWTADAG